ncbi:MAG: LTA synthase family protein [Gammaproteobacteria bacterium]|nr:LTA synthase family protein [Gammaproteobacteria bacterium]
MDSFIPTGAAARLAWLHEGLLKFGNLSLALLPAFLAVRCVELAGVAMTSEIPADLATLIIRAFWSDLLFLLQLLVFLLPVFLLLRQVFRGRRADLRCYGIVGSLVLAGYLILVNYFFVTRVPLGADLFGYSLADILVTARAGYQISMLSVLSFVVPFTVFWMVLMDVNRRVLLTPLVVYVALISGIVLAVSGISAPSARAALKNEFANSLALNKGAFFIADAYRYFIKREHAAVSAVPGTVSYTASQAARVDPLDPQYPFLRADDTPDVLGSYFTINPASPPSIVFIAVEGLGRAFSGSDAYLGSFTPFLDELAGSSLYWENFLASQGRTFASLPSILGSLPFGDEGFNALGARMPKHLTLLSILKRNGYRTRFYCGNGLDFDNQRSFLQHQNIDLMIGADDYGPGYPRLPDAYWGYADAEVLRKALVTERDDARTPYLDYIQTISMHTPYTVTGQQQYLQLFEERMSQLGFTEDQKQKYRQYQKIYSTILYTDAALRRYFEEQARLPSYNNTIFVITGDHRLPEIPLATKVDRYHVPLIIYSPLLKRTAQIKSISSHLDITPSLLAFLKKNYHIKAPDRVTWVGSGLDMSPALRNIHHYPLKHTINNLIDYISGMYFLNEDTLFRIGENMDLEPIKDDGKRLELRLEFDRYKASNGKFMHDLTLMPDDEHAAYFSQR